MLPQNQPQQFHSASWQQSPVQLPSAPSSVPQVQPQGYQNPPQYYQNHTSHPFDLSSMIPQQIMQDFLRLSTPVGSSPNDDTTIAQALHESRQSGKTYRQALEGLHGVNNHAANLWKDYYLDHHDRIDLLVSRLAEQPKTVKKPFVPSKSPPRISVEATSHQVARKRHMSPPRPSSPSPPRQSPKKKGRSGPSQASRRKRATPQSVTTATSTLTRPPNRPRATFNSLSAPLPSNDFPNLMPPQVHIPLPEPPSRSPTPPSTVQVGTNGNKYTKEDREYFLKFLVWRLKQNPLLTKKELCELLHEKAPHHSATSWSSHWHQRHDIADKIFATYHNNSDADAEDDEDQQDEEEEVEVEEEMKNDQDDDAHSEAMSADEASRDRKVVIRSEGTFSDFGDADTEEDEADMGEPGSSFSRGDWRILARFIAKNHWDEVSPKERWKAFTEAHETKRPGKSWAEFYRRNEVGMIPMIVTHSAS
ncbi:hypothetical protein L210DRAFT_992200 [Boletus edulis BED1]|uniref:Uncharacterized protein n=1 Tax=Boletus edulis BED1 TaxID=1328754 RepID=A0AAD4GIG4_BOLED|nr:hypothetical protein L210DRAFT_992200 [Boletus edulis BED1]